MSEPASVLCPLCGHVGVLGPGPGGRPSAACTSCGSLERHRFLAVLLSAVVPGGTARGIVLDVAPSQQVSPLLRALNPERYVSIDFDPAADGRLVDVAASLTDLPFRDQSVGFVICYHVLEHVPDDKRAMSELGRVLARDGLALVQVPWRPDRPTDEDPDAPPQDRVRRFGQADHVRYYGADFESRLRDAGLTLLALSPLDVLESEQLAAIGVPGGHTFWLCASEAGALPQVGEVRPAVHDAWTRVLTRAALTPTPVSTPTPTSQDAELQRLRRKLDVARANAKQARRDAVTWEKRYRAIRSQPVVRALAALRRPFR